MVEQRDTTGLPPAIGVVLQRPGMAERGTTPQNHTLNAAVTPDSPTTLRQGYTNQLSHGGW